MTTIRQFKDSDAPQMTAIYLRAVTALGKLRYQPEQVAVWAKLTPDADRLTELMNDGRTGFVAVTPDDTVVAFGDLEADGHIHFLYADPDVAGTGVVSTLYDAIEAKATADNLGKMYCEASELAKSFLLKKGFKVVERRDFEVAGVAIHNYAVEKRLRAPSAATVV
ncbi:GNAT family N-acetyltransferase [Thalassospira lucentensis]|uniref:GNAT family N-acetyltransferase n=1 Tax=Thalassospira lucentensis TaxID=168935 RepID=UPI003D28E38D